MISDKKKLFLIVFLCAFIILNWASTVNAQDKIMIFKEELQKFKNRTAVQADSGGCNGYFCAKDMVNACRHARMRPTHSIRKSSSPTDQEKSEAAQDIELDHQCINYTAGFMNGLSASGLLGTCSNSIEDPYGLAKAVVQKYEENPNKYQNVSAGIVFSDAWKAYCKK